MQVIADASNLKLPRTSVVLEVAHWSDKAFIPGLLFRLIRVSGLVLLDAVILAAGLFAAVAFWAIPVRNQTFELYLRLWPILPVLLLGFGLAGLYPGFGLGPVEILRRYWKWFSFSLLMVVSLSFIAKAPHLYSRLVVGWSWLFGLTALPTVRVLVNNALYRRQRWIEPTVVLTSSRERTDEVPAILARHHTFGYAAPWVFKFRFGQEAASTPGPAEALEKLVALVRRGVRVAIIACDAPQDLAPILRFCERRFRTVIVLQSDLDMPLHLADVRNIEGRLAIELRHELLKRRNRIIKRGFDLVGSAIGLVMVVPIIALAAVATKLASAGPIFYSQQREGKDGVSFKLWKLRTMFADAEHRLEAHLAEDDVARKEWSTNVKLRGDPRIVPRVGEILRRFSIDELPQLWNILRGDMSLVGPRPFPEYHLSRFSADFRDLRRHVLPGLTGMWQVSVRSEGDIQQQQALDEYYIRNWSLWIDVYLLAKTVWAVFGSKGAF